jgi:hypothetical protein
MSYFLTIGDTTICRPLSTFKIDCNICTCSRNGREYSCTQEKCPPWDGQKFLEENIEDGYVLLKPKPHHNKGTEADFVLTGKQSSQDVDNSFRLTSNKN